MRLLAACSTALLALAACSAPFSGAAKPSGPAPPAQRAIVLGGGGLTGHAWEAGILKGLRDAGMDLSAADLIVGTSAGAVIGAELRAGKDIESLYLGQLATPVGTPLSGRSAEELQYLRDTSRLWQGVSENTDALRQVGQRALATPRPILEEVQKSRWRAIVGTADWPDGPLKLSAVDVNDGTVRLFDRTQDAPLDAAVSASTAIPGLQAPITVGDRRYMDGGVAGAHIAAAAGYGTVIAVITGGSQRAKPQVEQLRSSGSRIVLIAPDAESAAAIGVDRFVISQIKPSAEAGLRQAALVAGDVRKVWNSSAGH